MTAAGQLAALGVSVEVIVLRSPVPLGTRTVLSSVVKTGRLTSVEENRRLAGWGAEISSIVGEEEFWNLDGPMMRMTTPHIPVPGAGELEDLANTSVGRIAAISN